MAQKGVTFGFHGVANEDQVYRNKLSW